MDGRDGLHLEGEEEGMVGYGAELESEAVSGGEEAGVGVAVRGEHFCNDK